MDLNEVIIFVRVAQEGSVRGAAEVLGMPRSTVSRKIASLEERLGARLLQRTTRQLSLTDVGRTYLGYCERIIAELEEAERAVLEKQGSPRGRLRVTAPINTTFLGPIVARYLEDFPDVMLELHCSVETMDLVEDRFDLSIRTGSLASSSLIAAKLGELVWTLVASPGYLEKDGPIEAPEALAERQSLLFQYAPGLRYIGAVRKPALSLAREGEAPQDFEIAAKLITTDLEVLSDIVLADGGPAYLPMARVKGHLDSGRLVQLLPGWQAPSTPVHALYPSTRHMAPAVRAFIDYLREGLADKAAAYK